MKKLKLKFKIDWKAKIADLLIVIIGITLAFRLDAWNEDRKARKQLNHYLSSFQDETRENIKVLKKVIAIATVRKQEVDTLRALLRKQRYGDRRLGLLSSKLTNTIDYRPTTITIEYIQESDGWGLIRDFRLRKNIIDAYNALEDLEKMEQGTQVYINSFVTPFFFNNIRYSNFYPVNDREFITDHRLENVIIGYQFKLIYQLQNYALVLEQLQRLEKDLRNK
ncbi:MAG: hypothetical protein ACFB0B_07790 [Thermonemataceae bacterium]